MAKQKNLGRTSNLSHGAHSFVDNVRSYNLANFADYKAEKTESENLSVKEQIEEKIMLGLRCNLGVDISDVKKLGYDITKNQYFLDYIKQGVIILEDDVLRLNPVFYHISNTIIANLIP